MFPKIGGKPPPKWMVKIMENPIKIDDLGVPLFLETPTCSKGSSKDTEDLEDSIFSALYIVVFGRIDHPSSID